MITIVIHAYEICTENVIKLIVCLEPGRGIDRHAYRDTVAAAYRYRYSYRYLGPVWVDDIDPVWITVAPKGLPYSTWHRSLSRTVMIPAGINI